MENNRKVVCYIATSVDGYIATTEDSLDWLFKAAEGQEGDMGYAEFIATIDTVVLGRRTYDWVMAAENGQFPYQDKMSYVFTSTVAEEHAFVTFTDQTVSDFVKALKEKPGENIWVVGGSGLLHSFVEENLIDEWIISIAPVLLGKGIPLFKEVNMESSLKLKSVKSYGDFVQLHYKKL
ncbi:MULTISPECIES: dihydrofolate reductase family protein [Planococcus]|uniref:Bacterial bifunctional deaminase-reductase C-terminal domain-containing protein n=1 Tax=Planococcus faecalis TaxID=1598147 RepID=A0ABM6ING9_9BACL|nr:MULTISPECIES: dihydrofolate reductase family protein [Planococcus]AQU78050.1 hypothetical protein AJGP001_01435 [Planococcus faecalis]MDJ0331329.1 dihydrofolate reductase family protein [Planococcus sp. S3-L1]OHX53669.1 hypothetical protein BB777_07865 [Planococcus faecalis]